MTARFRGGGTGGHRASASWAMIVYPFRVSLCRAYPCSPCATRAGKMIARMGMGSIVDEIEGSNIYGTSTSSKPKRIKRKEKGFKGRCFQKSIQGFQTGVSSIFNPSFIRPHIRPCSSVVRQWAELLQPRGTSFAMYVTVSFSACICLPRRLRP